MIIEFVTNTHTHTHMRYVRAPSLAFACLCLCTYIVYNTYITSQREKPIPRLCTQNRKDNSKMKSGRWNFRFSFWHPLNWEFFSNFICFEFFFELVQNLFWTLCIDTKGIRDSNDIRSRFFFQMKNENIPKARMRIFLDEASHSIASTDWIDLERARASVHGP